MMQNSTPPVHGVSYPPHSQAYTMAPTLSTSSSSLLVPQYPPTAISPQSVRSVDMSVAGPSAPPVKSSKLTSNSSTPRSKSIDPRRLILFNVPVDIIQEYLELYLEHLSAEAEIERIDYSNLEDTTVMVTFKTPLDMMEVRRRHGIRPKLNSSEISLAEVIPPATIMIRNLPMDISRDVLELYFSNRRRSDGGQVVDVTLDHEQQHALVTFADCEDVRRVIKREHSIHGHRLDVRIYYRHMGMEPFVDASLIDQPPDPIRFSALDDSRYLFLLKNRPLLDELREQLKSLTAHVSLQTEGFLEILYSESRLTGKRRIQWRKDAEKLVQDFVAERLVIHKVPWNNTKTPSITSEQLADLSLKDNTRLMQLIPTENQSDYILVTALKDHIDRALNELNDMLTAPKKPSSKNIPLNSAVYRSKPVSTIRDPKVNNQRSSYLFCSSPSLNSMQDSDLRESESCMTIDDNIMNLRLYQLDLLSMRFVELARQAYVNLSINIDRRGRRVHLCGPPDQVSVCKGYFQSILNGLVRKHYKIGKDLALFLSNPDTVEIIIGNLMRDEQVCAYEVERISNNHRRSTVSPIPNASGIDIVSGHDHSLSMTTTHHKLVLYALTRDGCDRAYDLIRRDVCVSSIMLDKENKRFFTSNPWQAYVRNLYSHSDGFRRRRALIQVKHNNLKLVGFKQDVDSMRKHIHDYFVENGISFYESD